MDLEYHKYFLIQSVGRFLARSQVPQLSFGEIYVKAPVLVGETQVQETSAVQNLI